MTRRPDHGHRLLVVAMTVLTALTVVLASVALWLRTAP